MDAATIEKKRQREKAIIAEMIDIFCSGNGHGGNCFDCEELKSYALQRVDACPHIETKSFCSICETHCYDHEHRQAVRQVMRYSGSRYFLKRPVKTLAHALCTIRTRLRQKRSDAQ